MMRYSSRTIGRTRVADGTTSKVIEQAGQLTAPLILLAGGSDLMSTRVRLAQSVLRYDERPSSWSHVGLILDISKKKPHESTGVEVRLAPPTNTGPERHYVSFFRLGDYKDHPNLALISFEERKLERQKKQPARVPRSVKANLARVREFALREHPGRPTYNFGTAIAAWQAHLFDPANNRNPLLANVPHPAAAYVDFVFASAGIEIVPSAVTLALAPEHIWATARHFESSAYRLNLRDQVGAREVGCSGLLPEDIAAAYTRFRKPAPGSSPA